MKSGFLKTLVARCLRSWKLYLDVHYILTLILDLGVGKRYGLFEGLETLGWFMALIDYLCWLLLGLRSWLLLEFEFWLLNPSPWLVFIGLRHVYIHIPQHIVIGLIRSKSLHPLIPLIFIYPNFIDLFWSGHGMITRFHYHSFTKYIGSNCFMVPFWTCIFNQRSPFHRLFWIS